VHSEYAHQHTFVGLVFIPVSADHLPQSSNTIVIEGCIGAHDLHLLSHGLSDEQPVEWVTMMKWHFR
jgi:hypothetical protein